MQLSRGRRPQIENGQVLVGEDGLVLPFHGVDVERNAIDSGDKPLRELLDGARQIGFLEIVVAVGVSIVIELQMQFAMAVVR